MRSPLVAFPKQQSPLSLVALVARLVVPLALVFGWSTDAHAYAWMIRHGLAKCSSCHTDPTGGETLNHMGRVDSQTLMSQPWGDNKVTNASKLLMGVNEPNWLRVGGSFRYMGVKPGDGEFKHFPMQADLYATADFGFIQAGASLGYASLREGVTRMRPALVTSNETGANLISRSHWLGFELGEHTLVRLGRLNLPFGIRVSEHTLWAREMTHTDRESSQQHGAAIAQSTERMRWEWMFILGNYQISPDDYRERGYSAFFEYLFTPKLAVGVSSLLTQSAKSSITLSQKQTLRQVHGLMARYSPVQPVVIMAEADLTKITTFGFGYTGFLIVDVEPLQGLHVQGTFEALNRGKPEGGKAVLGAGEMQRGYWLSLAWFPFPHFDVRLDAVFRDGLDGEGEKSLNGTYQGQVHLYL